MEIYNRAPNGSVVGEVWSSRGEYWIVNGDHKMERITPPRHHPRDTDIHGWMTLKEYFECMKIPEKDQVMLLLKYGNTQGLT